MNPPLERKELPKSLEQARMDRDEKHRDSIVELQVMVAADGLADSIFNECSIPDIVGLVWELLHHRHFECQDTYVQLVDALVRDLNLVMSVDIIELYNIGERLKMGTTTRRFSSEHPNEANTSKGWEQSLNKMLEDDEEEGEIDLDEPYKDEEAWRADELADEIDLEETAAILREEDLLEHLPKGETDDELAKRVAPESRKPGEFVGMVSETDEEVPGVVGRLKRTSDYPEEAFPRKKQQAASSGERGQKDEPTVSMTWWQCRLCRAARGIPAGELETWAGPSRCPFCVTSVMIRTGYAAAHESELFRCEGCGSKSQVLRCNIKPGLRCELDDPIPEDLGGGICCGGLLKLQTEEGREQGDSNDKDAVPS